jgi:hypothetical protein
VGEAQAIDQEIDAIQKEIQNMRLTFRSLNEMYHSNRIQMDKIFSI